MRGLEGGKKKYAEKLLIQHLLYASSLLLSLRLSERRTRRRSVGEMVDMRRENVKEKKKVSVSSHIYDAHHRFSSS